MINSINKGFTLLEILLVITLISILFGIVVFRLSPNNILSEIQDNQRESDALTIYQALEQYALKNNAYPVPIKNMSNNSSAHICKTTATTCDSTKINLSSILVPTYFSKIPEYSTDINNSGFYVVKDSNGKIGIGGVKQVDNTTFTQGLESQVFNSSPFSIVKDGLILHLDAGNLASYPRTGTTWVDLSGNNNNSSLLNEVGYNSENGGSMSFDGVDDRVDSINASSLTSMTIEMWIYDTRTSGERDILTYNGNSGSYTFNGSTFRTDGNNLGARSFANVGQPPSNQWYRLCYVKNGDLYINETKYTGSNSDRTYGILSFGNTRSGVNSRLNGKIANIKVYNRNLSNSEIQQNFNALRGRFGL